MVAIRVASLCALTCALAFTCWVAAVGQATEPPGGATTIHVLTDQIEVPVLAFRPPFRPEPGLTKSQFVIQLDGGTPFHPSHVRMEGDEPVNLTLLIEADSRDVHLLSQSLRTGIEHWPQALFTNADRVTLYLYGCRLVRMLKESRVPPGDDRNTLAQAAALPGFLSAMEGGRSCQRPPLDKLLETVMNQESTPGSWNVVLWVINAEHKADLKEFERVRAFAASKRVTIFAVKYFDATRVPASVYSTSEPVNRLVSAIGGITLHAELAELGNVTETVIEDIRKRYIVSFPSPRNSSGGAHWMDIQSTVRGVRVLSSAASAPLLEAQCGSGKEKWLCSEQRPQYGNQKP